MLPRIILDTNTKIDFYAGNDRSYGNLSPLYEALGERRGIFFASHLVRQNGTGLVRSGNIEGNRPIVVSSYKDLNDIFVSAHDRPFIMLENEHNTETRGLLNIVSLFLCKSQKTVAFRRGYIAEVSLFDTYSKAADEIVKFCKGKEVKHIPTINGKSAGIIYMAWGDKAVQAAKKSQATLRRLGCQYNVAHVGDFKENSGNWIEGYGCNIHADVNPFDISKARNFQFRAGRVKPLLCELSPFDYNLYIDADTQFLQPIEYGFELLNEYDLVVTEEKLTLKELYNKRLAGWEINLLEREQTIKELGDEQQKFINSGVIFFKRNKKTLKLFSDWQKEWMRFQDWDEQLALMRALHKNKLKVKRLGVEWNSPHFTDSSIIFHNYGRGDVRISQ